MDRVHADPVGGIEEGVRLRHESDRSLRGVTIGICGQAPSDYPEFARFLVEEGIDSISLNPDSVLKTTMALASLTP